MDKIITLIIIFYILRSVYRFISKEAEDKKDTKGASRQPHIPTARPTPSPYSKTGAGRPAPRQDFPSTWREVGQILRDLKREAEEKQEGIKIHDEIPILRQKESAIQHTKRIKDTQKEGASIQKKVHPKKLTEETVSLGKAKIIRKDKIEMAEIAFDQPGLFLQGIILSEILRPPMVRRNHLLPPYLRG